MPNISLMNGGVNVRRPEIRRCLEELSVRRANIGPVLVWCREPRSTLAGESCVARRAGNHGQR